MRHFSLIFFLLFSIAALLVPQQALAQDVVLTEDDYIIADEDSITEEQDSIALGNAYSCVNYAAGSLNFPAGMSARFKRLLLDIFALMAGEDKRINMVHIGGSHVQADIFTHRVRSNFSLATLPAIGARGCLFPFRALNTNASTSYQMKAIGRWSGARNVKNPNHLDLGIMGAAIRTTDSQAFVSLQLNSDSRGPRYDFNTLTILGESTSPDFAPVLLCNGEEIPAERIYATAYHDNLPATAYRYNLPDAVTECVIRFPGANDSTAFTLRGVIPENDTPGIAYTAAGVNGAAVPSWLSCSRFTDELQLLRPDLAIFAIGINDAATTSFSAERFKENYRQLLARFRKANPDCCFIFITNNDCFLSLAASGRYINPNTKDVQQAFYELAREYEGAVFDVYDIMGGKGSSNAWVAAGLMNKDHVHFSGKGYRLLGDMLYNAILTEVIKLCN